MVFVPLPVSCVSALFILRIAVLLFVFFCCLFFLLRFREISLEIDLVRAARMCVCV